VNIASRMESQGQAGKIQISQSTYDLLKPYYHCQERGYIRVKGKGKMKTYWLGDRP
jgi:adenylate cyclase